MPKRGHPKVKDAFKDELKKVDLKKITPIRETGCLDQCEHAPVVVVYPDAVWYGFVRPKDVEQIVEEHVVGGTPVERLRIADNCFNNPCCPHAKRKKK